MKSLRNFLITSASSRSLLALSVALFAAMIAAGAIFYSAAGHRQPDAAVTAPIITATPLVQAGMPVNTPEPATTPLATIVSPAELAQFVGTATAQFTTVPSATPTVGSSEATATNAPTVAPPAIPTMVPTATPAPPAPTATGVPRAVVPTPGSTANTALFRENAVNIPLDSASGLTQIGGSIQLSPQKDGQFLPNADIISREYPATIPFDNAVLSWNVDAPTGTRLVFQLRVGDGTSHSPWFTMGTWSATGGASVSGQSNAWGKVDVDTLELATAATTFQYRVTFSTDNPAASPSLRSVSIVYADLARPLFGPPPSVANGWQRDLPVPQYSQLDQDPSVARDICSPTSLAMILDFWGQRKTVSQVYAGVRDAQTGIFGDWPFNAAYAGALGFDSYIDRFFSLEQLENEIAQGLPVAISIRFQPGQLDNAPIVSTTGHLIVVRGFTAQGDVIVNDPIAPTDATVRRVYKRDQLGKVWHDSGGIVYIVKPR